MADSVVLISDSDSEGSRSPPLRPRRPPPTEIIDLTCEDTRTDLAPWSSLTIIDLTEDTCSPPHTTSHPNQVSGYALAAPAAHVSHPRLCSTPTQEREVTVGPSPAAPCHSTPKEPGAIMDTAESTENWSSCSPASSHHSFSCSPEQNCSTTTFNSDLGSLASMQLDSDLLSLSPCSLDSSSSCRAGAPEEETPHLCQQRELPPRLSPVPAIPTTPGKAQEPLLETLSDLPSLRAIQQATPAQTQADSKAWLNKLHCFGRTGVQDPFPQGITPNRGMPSLSLCSLDSSSSCRAGDLEGETPHLCQQRELPPRLSPVPAIPTAPRKAQDPLLEASDLPPLIVTQQVTPARTKADSKAWLNKLHYFRRSGVQHLFLQGVTPNREPPQKPELIPSGKMSMVSTTMEENFLEGTLHFLSEFVSCQHCPPKDIISHLIKQILLHPHQGEILKDIYMLLMKIQMLHPANTATVGWDWTLLKHTMEDQEKPPGRLLFLQYVVQTLEDDFQQNLRLRLLQKSIAKKVLSCDMCFNNVKEVVEWLVAAVTGVGFSQPKEEPQEITSSSAEARAERSSSAPWLASTDQAEVAPAFFAQKVMLLLQRMLSLAVEVDKSPNCSSCKIADVIFPFILNIPLRSQREAFINTMESQLLRCKLLELLFQHSCDVPTTLPLSPAKILYFLSHSSVLLQYQDETAMWQRWDEMLQYLSLLLLSYQNVIMEHLRSSLNDRMDLIIRKAKPKLQDSNDISHLDIELNIKDFISRMQQILEQPFPLQIEEKLCMLRELFLIVTAT
ncbi:SUMO-interacting motif-containing protein 1 isoform X2 [Apus apus]|uniref:SUMO-interacting motif-containing protein 1 isoform X2 n=1 Tax=Apus apus TaxID=8895 RepID=UPI0021F85FDA|nr:SUMO-interacting motif-containing protein 1 isoform X2 [Apus apus]